VRIRGPVENGSLDDIHVYLTIRHGSAENRIGWILLPFSVGPLFLR